MIIETNRGLILGAKAELLRPDRVVAEWTHRSITPNDKFVYLAAKYVEADKPNENKHYWSFEDLQNAQSTVVNSPINIMHQPHNIIGVMIDQEMQYPVSSARDVSPDERKKLADKGHALPDGSFPIANKEDLSNAIQAFGRAKNKAAAKRHIIKRAKQLGATKMLPDTWDAIADEDSAAAQEIHEPVLAYDYLNPFLEVLGVLWRFYFPRSIERIEAAQEMGALHISMECICDTVTRVDQDGTEQDFPFVGGNIKEYGFHDGSMYVRLNDPHFVGAGLVIPPARPGWRGAEVRELASAISDDKAEAIYNEFKSTLPQLDPQIWEDMMLTVLTESS